MSIAERIKQKRKSNGLTQARLSELIGVSPMSVRRWEWGERVPNAEMIPKLAEVLQTSVSYLMEGEAPDARKVIKEESVEGMPGMGYWGGVVDNARELARRGDGEEISDVVLMLERALSCLIKGGNQGVKLQGLINMPNFGGHHNNNLKLGNVNI